MQTKHRIRPPEFKGPPRFIPKQLRNPLIERRISLALKEYQRHLKKHGSENPGIFYGSERFRKSRRYKQTMSIFAGLIEYLGEARYLNNSQVPWPLLIRDWFTAIFEYYARQWNRCPMPMQISPTNAMTTTFDIFIRNYSNQYGGEFDYWAQKPDQRSFKEKVAQAREHRKNEVASLRGISSLWDEKHVLADLRKRFGPHVKSIEDYIENGGTLDDRRRRQPAEWV